MRLVYRFADDSRKLKGEVRKTLVYWDLDYALYNAIIERAEGHCFLSAPSAQRMKLNNRRYITKRYMDLGMRSVNMDCDIEFVGSSEMT